MSRSSLPRRVLLNAGRYADPAGFRQRFEPSGDIDPVTMNVVAVDDDVAKIDADAPFDAAIRRHRAVAIGHPALPFGRTTQGIDDAGEFNEQPIAGRFDDPAAMFGDLRID